MPIRSRKPALWLACLALAMPGLTLCGCSPAARKARHQRNAAAYFEQGKYNEAIIEYMHLLRADPDDPVVIRQIGLALFATGSSRQAFPFLFKAHETDPSDADVAHKLAVVYLWGGQPDQARRIALSVLDKDPANVDAVVLLADAAVTPKDREEARATIRELGDRLAGEPRFHIAVANLCIRDRSYEDAAKALDRAAAIAPAAPEVHLARGVLLKLQGKLDEADREYEAAAAGSALDSPARIHWAVFKMETGRTEEARRILEEITQKHPLSAPAWYRLAEVAFAERNFDDCLKFADKVLKIDPSQAEAGLLRGRALLAKGEVGPALGEYNELVKSYPGSPQLRYYLALALLQKGDAAQAGRELRQALEADPSFTEAALLLAEIDIRSGEPAAAAGILQKVIEANPDLPQAYVLMGTAYRGQRMADKAAETYRKLIQLAPASPQGYYLLGSVLREQGRGAEAAEAFEKALAARPEFVFALAQLVSMQIQGKDFDRAAALVRKQIDAVPKAPGLQYLLGRVYMLQGSTDKAEEAFRTTIEMQPKYTPAYAALAQLYAAAGKSEDALRQIDEALAINTNHLPSLMLAGLIYQKQKDLPRARQVFERILSISPSFAPAANNLAYLCAENFGELDKAYALAQKARQAAPHDPYIADTLGWVQYKRGEYKWASSLLRESLEQVPDHPEILYHLAAAETAQGRETAARESLRRALDAGADFESADAAEELLTLLEIDPARPIGEADVAALKGWTDRQPLAAAAHLRLGAAREQRGENEAARREYEAALRASPQHVGALVRLARLYADKLRDPGKAADLAKTARDLAADDPETEAALGWIAYLSGDYPWSFSLLQGAAARLADRPDVRYQSGLAAFAMGRAESAAGAIREALKMGVPFAQSDEASQVLPLIEAVAAGTADDGVLKAADAMLQSNPASLPAQAVNALGAMLQGRHQQARAAYESILKSHPDFVPAIRSLTVLHAGMGESSDAAVKISARARELLPDDPAVAAAAGRIAFERGELKRAEPLLQQATTLRPKDAENWYLLGLSRARLGQADSARAALNKGLELEPQSARASAAREALAGLE